MSVHKACRIGPCDDPSTRTCVHPDRRSVYGITGQINRKCGMRKLKKSSAQMVADARAGIEEIESEKLISMLGDPDLVIVDIRDIRERQRSGYIPGSIHAPRGMVEFWVDPESPYFKEIFGNDRKFVFHCASGWRSALTVSTLQDMGFEAAHLKKGFSDWVRKGGPIEGNPDETDS